jgi:hypothetical protein
LGSDFGSAQTSNIMGQNSAITSSIGDERRAKIAEVLGKARTQISDTIAAKRKAQQDGLDSYLSFLGTASERKKANVKNLGSALLTQGLSPEDVDPVELAAIAKSYGVSVDDIISGYNDVKSTQATAEGFTLTPGGARYDASGKLIAERAPEEKSDSLTPYQKFQATQAIAAAAARNTSAATELKRQGDIINQTWDRYKSGEAGDLNATTQALVTTFNKILDPGSVVRETEYDRSAAGQSLLASIEGKLARVSQGGPGLTPESLQEIVDLANSYTANAQASVQAINERAQKQAEYFGLNSDFVTTPGFSGEGSTSEDAAFDWEN